MEISRIFKVISTLILTVAFLTVTVSAYRQNEKIERIANLSDATSNIAIKLTSKSLAWKDKEKNIHPHVIDPNKTENLDFSMDLAGENFRYKISIIRRNNDNGFLIVDSVGPKPPKDKMTCSMDLSVAIRKLKRPMPGKLKVLAWYA